MPSFATLFAALLVVGSPAVQARPSLGHHASPELTELSRLPPVVASLSADGLIETSLNRRDELGPYYGDERGWSRPPPLGNAKRATPPSWTSLGCVSEGRNGRTLSSWSYTDNKVTVETCLAKCLSKGYTIAGMQWSTECWCGNEFVNGGGAKLSASECNYQCAGDKNEICGAAYKISAYQYSASAPACSSTPVAPSATVSATASASASGSTSGSGSGSASGSASGSGSGSAFVSASASASASAPVSSAPAPSASAPASTGSTEWESLGCFLDNPAQNGGLHILQGSSQLKQTNMTPALCQARCETQGYNFAGLEFGEECWCGDLTEAAVKKLSTNVGGCDKTCTGDKSQKCGGGWALQLYEQVDVTDCSA